MEREEYFKKMAEATTKAMQLRWFGKKDNTLKGGVNDSFKSLEVGNVTNTCASFYTTTIKYDDGDSKDVVVMNAYDADKGEGVEVLFDKDDCLEFMSYLATAAYSLRG